MFSDSFFVDSPTWRIACVISLPDSGYRWNIVLLSHWFWSHKERSAYLSLEEYFTKAWMWICRFDFFGHGESDGDFFDITISKAFENVVDVRRHLQTHYWFSSYALFWSSFGGNVVLNVVHQYPSTYAFVLAKCPVSDYKKQKVRTLWLEAIEEREKTWSHVFIKDYNTPTPVSYDFFDELDRYNVHDFIDKLDLPVFLIHGDQDDCVLVDQSIKTANLCPQVTLHIQAWAGHAFNWPWEKEVVSQLCTDFALQYFW